MRRLTLTATTLLLVPAADAAAKTPAAVTKAAASVEIVQSNTPKGSAVRVGPDGAYLTPSVLVARTAELVVTGADKRSNASDRAESNAPTGLALLERRGGKAPAGLTPAATRVKRGATVYVIVRPLTKDAKAPIVTETKVATSSRQALTLRAKNRAGLNGGAVVDREGRLLGVTVPPLPGTGINSPQRAIPVTETPVVQSDTVAEAGPGFPAIPVTVGVGVLLLLSQLLLLRRRRVGSDDVLGPVGASAPPAASAAAPAPVAPADDFEITLRSKS